MLRLVGRQAGCRRLVATSAPLSQAPVHSFFPSFCFDLLCSADHAQSSSAEGHRRHYSPTTAHYTPAPALIHIYLHPASPFKETGSD